MILFQNNLLQLIASLFALFPKQKKEYFIHSQMSFFLILTLIFTTPYLIASNFRN
jgi:hypothetical protein